MSDLRTAAEIARALGGNRSSGAWTCRCPAHDDRNPSLSICEAASGKILLHCHAGCDQLDVIEALRDRGLWPQPFDRLRAERPKPASATDPGSPRGVAKKAMPAPDDAERIARARSIWRESSDSKGTWAEDYPVSRNLKLPDDPEIRCRILRFHPHCPFPDKTKAPALIAAFTPIEPDVLDDPFLDPLPTAIHRIRGKGHDNKKMLGPVKGCAIMISPWWHVHETLHVCEGVETALALYNEGADDPEDCRRPIWALGSKTAIKALPIIHRVHRLVIWADNDANGGSVEAAMACGKRWRNAGKTVVIRYPEMEGEDFADWRSP